MWNAYGIKMTGWNFAIRVGSPFVLLGCREIRIVDAMSHDANSFHMMVQTNHNVIPARTSLGDSRFAPRAVSLGSVGEKLATGAKQRQHSNTQDIKEVMTCYTMSHASE